MLFVAADCLLSNGVWQDASEVLGLMIFDM
jgi:hypothetical protein